MPPPYRLRRSLLILTPLLLALLLATLVSTTPAAALLPSPWPSVLLPTAGPMHLPAAPESRAPLHRCLLCRVSPPVSPTVLRPLLAESSASLRRSRLLLLSSMPPLLLPAPLPWIGEWALAKATL